MDDVDPASLEAALTPPLDGPVRWLKEIPSTNDEVTLAARAGAPEGLVVGADHQTAGRGRRGRMWSDEPASSLAMSILLRPQSAQSPGLLPLVVALGVAEGLSGLVDAAIGIVWPNDLVCDDKKLTGILCEMGWQGGDVEWAVAGVGINVNAAPAPMSDARFQPTCLKELGFGGPRRDVARAAIRGISEWYSEWQSVGTEPVLSAYRGHDALAGREVTVSVDDAAATQVVGTAAGIDSQGRLVVVTATGEQRFAVAEVQHVRR